MISQECPYTLDYLATEQNTKLKQVSTKCVLFLHLKSQAMVSWEPSSLHSIIISFVLLRSRRKIQCEHKFLQKETERGGDVA